MISDYIIKGGKTEYLIIYPKNAAPAEKFAAKELSDYLFKATGVSLKTAEDSESLQQ